MSGIAAGEFRGLLDGLGVYPSFNNYFFLLLFLPVALACYWQTKSVSGKKVVLTIVSMLFYAMWDIRFAGLLVLSSAIDYIAASNIYRSRYRLSFLMVSILTNLTLLGFFKYGPWLAENAYGLLGLLGVPAPRGAFTVVLPLGISFYTFQTMSYTIDVYRRRCAPAPDWLHYFTYVSFFPQLVSGPIVRFTEFSPQLSALLAGRRFTDRRLSAGLTLIVIGLFKKAVVADSLGAYLTRIDTYPYLYEFVTAWSVAIATALRVYFDFAGYTDIALGVALLFGFVLPRNFYFPFSSASPTELWRRWHITLGRYIRDYVYIPVGGNRLANSRRLLLVLFTAALFGLWHGAAWSYVAWGAYIGVGVGVFQLTRQRWQRMPIGFQWVCTQTWFLFSVPLWKGGSVEDVALMYRAMLNPSSVGSAGDWPTLILPIGVLLATAISPIALRYVRQIGFPVRIERPIVVGALLALILLALSRPAKTFIYYQF